MELIRKYWQPTSTTFWIGVGMLVAGAFKWSGLDIPVIPDVELLNQLAPEDAGTLIKGGLLAITGRAAVESLKA
jgi:hypothetical protein